MRSLVAAHAYAMTADLSTRLHRDDSRGVGDSAGSGSSSSNNLKPTSSSSEANLPYSLSSSKVSEAFVSAAASLSHAVEIKPRSRRSLSVAPNQNGAYATQSLHQAKAHATSAVRDPRGAQLVGDRVELTNAAENTVIGGVIAEIGK